jgi:hypothetical protein
MFQRGAGITEVLMPEKTSDPALKVDEMADNPIASTVG